MKRKRVVTEPMKLDKESIQDHVREKLEMVSKLAITEVLSILDFTMMICGTEMPDVFVTEYDLLHDNKHQIEANIGVKIMTLKEANAYAETEGVNPGRN